MKVAESHQSKANYVAYLEKMDKLVKPPIRFTEPETSSKKKKK